MIPLPAENAPAREWALFLAAGAERRGNPILAALWRAYAAAL